MIELNSVLQDRYLVERLLGQGGMGAVYLAVDRRFGSTVALKETLVQGEPLRRAFEREARLLNKLRHAALPVVLDYFTEGATQFLVMQFIPGEDFGELLASRGSGFPSDDVLRWADHLLDALEYLHSQEPPVIHRDIKPQNFKLTPRGEIILLDFGLAKGAPVDMSQLKGTGSVYGYTPHYAPFEQIRGAGTDARSDLYSLAATLYHLLTAELPPDAMTRAEAAMLKQEDPLRLASDVEPGVPHAVAAVLHKALAMDREERFSSAAEMREALRAAAASDAGATIAAGATPAADATIPKATIAAGGRHAEPRPTMPQQAMTMPATGVGGARPWLWSAIAAAVVTTLVLGAAYLPSFFSSSTPANSGETAEASLAAPEPSMLTTAPAMSTFAFETGSLGPDGAVRGRKQATGQFFTVEVGEGAVIDMVNIPAGKFQMGSPDAEAGRFVDEGPLHEVDIPSFFLSRHEVTQAQWRAVAQLPKVKIDLPESPSRFAGDDRPVENVTWEQAMEFCTRLARKAHREFRLPSESEWEYAARAGTTTPFAFGETISPAVANYDAKVAYGSGPAAAGRGETVPAGSLGLANGFGLYDMHGNVWEWCYGEYHDNYEGAPTDGSPWVDGGDVRNRTCRGGAWNTLAPDCRSANRYAVDAYEPPHNIGFRVAMRVAKQ
jgi:formylglycine-generating enzyme required for sulfatase activity